MRIFLRASGRIAVVAAAVLAVAPAVAVAGTNPPVLAGSVSNASSLNSTVSVAVSGNYAYTTAYHAGALTAVNISNPSAPTVTGSTSPFLDTNLIGGSNVAIAGGYAFVVSKNRNASTSSNDDGNGNSLTIVDIHTNPAQPSIVGTIRSPTELFGAYGVAVQGNYAYVAYQGLLGSPQPSTPDTSTGGFTVIDISSPGGPQIVANIDNGSLSGANANALNHATSVAISGNYAYVNAFNHQDIAVIDISNPTSPQLVHVLSDPNLALVVDLGIQGNYLYAADQAGGTATQFAVVDISNPTAPKVKATVSNTSLAGAYRIRVRGDFAYESARNTATVGAIDISDPLHPRLAGWLTDPAHLNKTTGLDLSSGGDYVVASSPYLSTESNATFPPYPLQSGGGTNTGTISVIQLDPNPLAVSIGSEPADPTAQTSATFGFSVNDDVSAVQCSLDGAPLGPCTSPTSAQYSGLAVGSHTFTVQATGTAGNTSTQSYTWTVGTVPANISAPTISDTSPVQGELLTANPGTWSGSPAPSFSYQWDRCNSAGTQCVQVATGQTYTVQPADTSNTLKVVVTADNGLGSPAPASSQITSVIPATNGAPVNTTPPGINGSATVGTQLSASAGSWQNNPASFTYQWIRCDQTGQNCAPIGSPSSSNVYTLVPADTGSTIIVTVTATNPVGQGQASSSAAGPVTGPPQNTSGPTITGSVSQGQTLTANPGGWLGYPAPSFSYAWQRCNSSGTACAPIAGATAQSYVLTRADVGNTLEVVVTAGNGVAPNASASSAADGPIQGRPANTVAPRISGTALQGQTLTASPGTWTGYPVPTLTFQWERCTSSGGSCVAISGATKTTYTLVAADVGHTLRIYVRGANSLGSVVAHSAQTGSVAAGVVGSAVLVGVANGSPQLKITVRAAAAGRSFNRITVQLPSGMGVAGEKRILQRAIRALDGSGRALRFTAVLRGGKLIVSLRKPVRSLKLSIDRHSLAVSHAVRAEAQHNRGARVRMTLIIAAPGGLSTRDTVAVPVS